MAYSLVPFWGCKVITCILIAVGTPGFDPDTWGSEFWMKDAEPTSKLVLYWEPLRGTLNETLAFLQQAVSQGPT